MWQKEIKVANGIKVVNQLILVETILDALGWGNVITRVEGGGRREGQSEKGLTS